MTEEKSLHLKYRPADLEDIIGQDSVVDSLAGVLKKGTARAFVFTGPSGVGKTTLGRIIAKRVGCIRNVVELDAATNSGVDAMRAISESAQYSGLGGSPTKVYIIDECHSLSKAAWQSLLKIIEEPPKHVYWVLCTTEAGKIPATIMTRCATYDLRPLSNNLLLDLLEKVRDAEDFKTPDDVLQLIASKSEGSPRRALTGLTKCYRVRDRKEAAELMNVVGDEEEGEVIDLCRALMKDLTWEQAVNLIAPLKDQNPESIRQVVVAYLTTVLLGTKSPEKAANVLEVLDAFSRPYTTNHGIYPVLLSVGEVVFRR